MADPNEEGVCAPPEGLEGQSLSLVGPVAWASEDGQRGGVAYRSAAANRITLLDTDQGDAQVVHLDAPEAPILMRATPDRHKLLVLSAQEQVLRVLRPGEDGGEAEDYALGSPFNALSVSEDGRFVIAHFAPGSSSDRVVSNNNEIAVIDLSAPPDTSNPQLLSLRSFGSRLTGIQFAPPFTLRGGEERRTALIFSDSYATLLELDGFDPANPNANETVIRFTQEGDNRSLQIRQVLWTDDDPNDETDFFAFLLTEGSDDILSLNLLPSDELDAQGRAKIRPSLNQLTGGRRPVSIALFKTDENRRKLLAVNQSSRDLAVIDVATSDTTLVPLEVSVNQAIVYDAINRDTDEQEPYAVLYNTDGTVRSLLFVELETVEVRRTRAIRTLNLDRGIVGMTMTPDPGGIPRALVLHTGLVGFSILNLERQFVTPLDVTSAVSSFAFADQETLLTSLQGQPWLSFIELNTGHPTSIKLDRPAYGLAVIPQTNTLVVDHGDELGSVTLLPLDDPRRDRAKSLRAFGADGLLGLEVER